MIAKYVQELKQVSTCDVLTHKTFQNISTYKGHLQQRFGEVVFSRITISRGKNELPNQVYTHIQKKNPNQQKHPKTWGRYFTSVGFCIHFGITPIMVNLYNKRFR